MTRFTWSLRHSRFLKKLPIELSYLWPEPGNWQRAVQDIIRETTFDTQGQLPANAGQCLSFSEAVPLPGALKLCGLVCGHHDDPIHAFMCPRFDQERRIVYDHGIWMLPGDGVGLPDLFACHARMHDAIQDRQFPGMMKNQIGQGDPVQRAVGLKHPGPEVFDNLFPGRFARRTPRCGPIGRPESQTRRIPETGLPPLFFPKRARL